MTALGLQKKGYQTIIVEKEKAIGNYSEKIDITEEIGLESVLKEYKIKPELTSNISHWHAGKESFVFKSKIKDLFFIRGKKEKSLERQLFNRAVKKGADYKLSVKVKFQNNKIFIDKKEIKARIVIGADGVNSIVTKFCMPEEKKKNNSGLWSILQTP